MNTFGQRRVHKLLAAHIRQQVRRQRRLNRLQRIAVLQEQSEAMLRALHAPPTNPLSVEALVARFAALQRRLEDASSDHVAS